MKILIEFDRLTFLGAKKSYKTCLSADREAPNVLALAESRRLLAKIYTPLRCVSKFFNARALGFGNALRNVRVGMRS